MLKIISSSRKPAQQTTMSRPPKASSARSTTPRPPAIVVTLSGLATACPPAAWISLTTESGGGRAARRAPAHAHPVVFDDHTCARACQPQRDRAADAAARARHRRDFSLEERHTRIGYCRPEPTTVLHA